MHGEGRLKCDIMTVNAVAYGPGRYYCMDRDRRMISGNRYYDTGHGDLTV